MRYSELRVRLSAISPLISRVLNEDHALLRKRPVDMRWYYADIVPISCVGFNPLSDTIFYGCNSHVDKILNNSNELVGESINSVLYEVMFCIHDYLHIWAVQRALGSFPQCYDVHAFFDREILADIAFVLILSEVVATVTLDWWLLPKFDLKNRLGVPNTFSAVTTPIDAFSLGQINVDARASITQRESFFYWMATGYFSGQFPKLGHHSREWMTVQPWFIKEVEQSFRQRELVRSWLTHISGLTLLDDAFLQHAEGQRVCAVSALASEMWRIANAPSLLQKIEVPIRPIHLPRREDVYDFRFTDILHISNLNEAAKSSGIETENFGYLAAQFVSLFNKDEYPDFSADDFDECVRRKDWPKLCSIFGAPPASLPNPNRYAHLFLPN